MEITPMGVEGAWLVAPRQHPDERGTFLEWFRQDRLEAATGRGLDLAQVNCSVSAAGVVRGVHFADVPPGQAKYVMCAAGAVLDVVVDLRAGSPTFGRWEQVLLDAGERRAVLVGEGLGHAFCALEDGSTVVYLCSTTYDPAREHGVHPLDPELGIPWPRVGADGRPLELRLSDKDAAAPSLREALETGVLPQL